jgi:hypothetical protein
VCQYDGRLCLLYSMLHESSELFSYYEIQKWMWTYAVTCCAECIRLLAGRGKNIWHEVWSLSTVITIQYTTYTRIFFYILLTVHLNTFILILTNLMH